MNCDPRCIRQHAAGVGSEANSIAAVQNDLNNAIDLLVGMLSGVTGAIGEE